MNSCGASGALVDGAVPALGAATGVRAVAADELERGASAVDVAAGAALTFVVELGGLDVGGGATELCVLDPGALDPDLFDRGAFETGALEADELDCDALDVAVSIELAARRRLVLVSFSVVHATSSAAHIVVIRTRGWIMGRVRYRTPR